jgi:hypothetical protein
MIRLQAKVNKHWEQANRDNATSQHSPAVTPAGGLTFGQICLLSSDHFSEITIPLTQPRRVNATILPDQIAALVQRLIRLV